MLTYKNKRATDKEHAHVDVYLDEVYLGYYMVDGNAPLRSKWVFESRTFSVQYFVTTTVKKLKEILELQVNKKPVTLNQHFGIVTKLNY